MQTIQVDYKKKRIEIKDQNKKLIYFLRFIFGLNILNAIIFYLIFNNQNDSLKWIWLVFAILNVLIMYILLTKASLKNSFDFKEVQTVTPISFLGLFLKLKEGKYRKIFMPRNSEDAQKLMKSFNNS